MVTDPPYGVRYDPEWRKSAGIGGKGLAKGKVKNDDSADWREAYHLFPGDVAYVWHAGTKASVVEEGLRQCGFEIRAQIIWAKSNLVIGRGHYHSQHEPCWYAVKKGRKGHWRGGRKQATVWRIVDQILRPDEIVFVRREDAGYIYAISGDESTVWEIPKPRKSETGHSTQKPVECMRRPMANNSAPGDSVYDPFLGSGSALVAAEMIGRSCYGMELEPKYCDVIVDRWQQFTGKQAVLQSTNQSFDEVRDGR